MRSEAKSQSSGSYHLVVIVHGEIALAEIDVARQGLEIFEDGLPTFFPRNYVIYVENDSRISCRRTPGNLALEVIPSHHEKA